MLDESLFETFSRGYDPPCSVIEELISKGSPQVQEALRTALEDVSGTALNDMDTDARAVIVLIKRGRRGIRAGR